MTTLTARGLQMTRDEFLDQAVRTSLGITGKESEWPFIAEYVPGSMLDPEYVALEMFQYELMAYGMRAKYGFNDQPDQD